MREVFGGEPEEQPLVRGVPHEDSQDSHEARRHRAFGWRVCSMWIRRVPLGYGLSHTGNYKSFSIGSIANKSWKVVKAELLKCELPQAHALHEGRREAIRGGSQLPRILPAADVTRFDCLWGTSAGLKRRRFGFTSSSNHLAPKLRRRVRRSETPEVAGSKPAGAAVEQTV
jgi:hypothetical protein